MNTRLRHIPLIEIEAGMVLGAPVRGINKGILGFSLPAGHKLTQDNLQQLTTHQAEFICVEEEDTRSDEQIASDNARAARQVMAIFAGANLKDSTMASLLNQVLAYRRS